MIVIGLDLSLTNTGVSIIDNLTGPPIMGSIIKTNPKEMLEARIEHIRATIRLLLREFPPTLAVVEGHTFGPRAHAATQIHEVAGVVKNLLYRRKILTYLVPPATLKKAATGDGRAKKPEMIAAAQILWPKCPNNDNIADAFHLARYGLEIVVPQIQIDVQ